jgi:hypothetical protein
MTLHRYLHWNRLIGAPVAIRQHGHTIRTGTVEDAMPDSSALWLASDGVQPRTMYEAALNYEAWVEPRQLTGTSCYRMTSSLLHPDDQEQRSTR